MVHAHTERVDAMIICTLSTMFPTVYASEVCAHACGVDYYAGKPTYGNAVAAGEAHWLAGGLPPLAAPNFFLATAGVQKLGHGRPKNHQNDTHLSMAAWHDK